MNEIDSAMKLILSDKDLKTISYQETNEEIGGELIRSSSFC